jgi:hypothetical protein
VVHRCDDRLPWCLCCQRTQDGDGERVPSVPVLPEFGQAISPVTLLTETHRVLQGRTDLARSLVALEHRQGALDRFPNVIAFDDVGDDRSERA